METTATVDVRALPHAHVRTAGAFAGATDPRTLLAQAEAAERTHDFDRARSLYSAALAQNPSDSEALAGLGDVSHSLHDLAGAVALYKRALAVNPVYLPALVGMGDAEYEAGKTDEAQKTYRDITERFPDGTYPPRVRQRAEGTASAGGGGAAVAPGSTGGASGSESGPTGTVSGASSGDPAEAP